MAVIYQKDKNAIRCITEFYSQFTKHKLSEYEIDSILAQYDGDYEQMIKDAYAQFSKHTPTQKEITSIINHYGLKKKDSADSTSDSEGGTSDLSKTKTDLNLSTEKELTKKYKNGRGVQNVTDNLKKEYNMSVEQSLDAATSPDKADEILSKNNGVWKFSEQNFLTMSDLEKIELEYEEKKDVID